MGRKKTLDAGLFINIIPLFTNQLKKAEVMRNGHINNSKDLNKTLSSNTCTINRKFS